MQVHIKTALRAIIQSDPTISVADRTLVMDILDGKGTPPSVAEVVERIVDRKETAYLMAKSTRTVDALGRSGALERVRLPGRRRGAGYRLSDVNRLITGKGGAA